MAEIAADHGLRREHGEGAPAPGPPGAGGAAGCGGIAMKLDDLARRAADEVREASREARFTVRAPGSRPPWARPLVALAAAAVVLAVGIPLLFLYGPRAGPVIDGSRSTTTTTVATTTTTAPPTTTQRRRRPRRRRRRRARRWTSWWPPTTPRATPRTVTPCGRSPPTTAPHADLLRGGADRGDLGQLPPPATTLPPIRCRGSRCWGSSSCPGMWWSFPVAYTYPDRRGCSPAST